MSPHLVYLTPQPVSRGADVLPSRPAALLLALQSTNAFASVTVIHRARPWQLPRLALRDGAGFKTPGAVSWRTVSDARAIAHAAPFGALERWTVERLVHEIPTPRVIWVADPKSAPVLARLASRRAAGDRLVFDAYDAWDLSPLVRGRWRRGAVLRGYRAAASAADIVFANTPFMVNRMRTLGASKVLELPNGSPSVDPRMASDPAYLVYLGRIHERFDATLVDAVASAFPDVTLRIAGPIERIPPHWRRLLLRPNVHAQGGLTGEEARALLGGARALLVPHAVDDYTRSQDAMKAWDAIALGTPVVSTSIPPADRWPETLALRADDDAAMIAAVGRILAGELDASRDARLAFAAANTWDERATTVLSALGG